MNSGMLYKTGKHKTRNMKKINLFYSATAIIVVLMTSCSGGMEPANESAKQETKTGPIGDNEIKIDNQVWMAKNLGVDKFCNGDLIPEAKTEEEWKKADQNKQPAWCYFNNEPSNGAKYGKLYNWYAVKDPRGLAPKGWHIPSDAEWTKLINFLGGKGVAGTKMKSSAGWKNNSNGSNVSGFNGLPGGCRDEDGDFKNIEEDGYWWSSSEDDGDDALLLSLSYMRGYTFRFDYYKAEGLSVRCLRD